MSRSEARASHSKCGLRDAWLLWGHIGFQIVGPALFLLGRGGGVDGLRQLCDDGPGVVGRTAGWSAHLCHQIAPVWALLSDRGVCFSRRYILCPWHSLLVPKICIALIGYSGCCLLQLTKRLHELFLSVRTHVLCSKRRQWQNLMSHVVCVNSTNLNNDCHTEPSNLHVKLKKPLSDRW